jgi:maleylacetoacetate isomerase
MDDLQLYGYFRSSASFRVRIALNLKGLSYDQVGVHLVRNGGEQFLPGYRSINPAQLVPTLIHGSESFTQSLAIVEYLEELFTEPPLLPRNASDRAFVRSVALDIACDMHPLNNLRVLKYLQGTLEATDKEKQEWYAHWILRGFDALEERLHNDPRVGAFVCGDVPGLADLCLVPQVWNARRFNVSLDRFPTLTRIADHAASLPAFASADPAVQPDADAPTQRPRQL